MTPDYAVYRPPNPPARRAGLMMLVLAAVALLFGGGLLAAGIALPRLEQDPAVRERLAELRREISIDPRVLFVAYGGMLLLYAVAALSLGLLVRRGGRMALIVTLIGASLVSALAAFSTVMSIAAGEIGGALLPGLVLAAHGMIIKWTLDALRQTQTATSALPTSQQPMEAYHQSPTPPTTRI